jgi:hypothetical protein
MSCSTLRKWEEEEEAEEEEEEESDAFLRESMPCVKDKRRHESRTIIDWFFIININKSSAQNLLFLKKYLKK